MAKLNLEQPHSLQPAVVRERLEKLRENLEKYHLTADWVAPTEAKVKGPGVTGKICILPTKVAVDLDLSILLTPAKGKIEERVKQHLADACAPA